MTFSQDLAEHINTTAGNQYQLRKVDVKRGRRLEPGERSSTGAYGLVDSRKHRLLRVPLSYDIANLLCDHKSRYLTEASLELL